MGTSDGNPEKTLVKAKEGYLRGQPEAAGGIVTRKPE